MTHLRSRPPWIAGLSILLLLILPSVLPAEGEAPADSVLSLEESLPTDAPAMAKEDPFDLNLFGESPMMRSDCSASNDCGGGTPVSCTGSSTCQVLSNGVKCDGVTTTCPDFCTAWKTCYCWCKTIQIDCSSNAGNCQTQSFGVTCDGQTYTCASACYQECGHIQQ